MYSTIETDKTLQDYSCVSVMGGQQKQFDLEKQEAVSLIIER